MELRRDYKQTEVGVIPNDWEIKPLKRISPSQSVGLVINPSTYFDKTGTVPLLVGSNVAENTIDTTTSNYITKTSNEMLTASRLASGDLVTVRVGDPGITAVVPPELDGCNCASMMIVRQHPSFDSHWLCCMMNSRHGRKQVDNVQYGTAQKQFNISDAVDFLYPFPPLPEQRAIATALSDVDELLTGLTQLISKKRDLKQAAMQQLLTGKTRLPGFSGEWEVKRLGDVANVLKGSKLSKSLVTESGNRPCILYGELFTTYGRVISEIVHYTNSDEGYPSISGDVLMPGSTTTTGIDLATASVILLNNVALGGDILIIRKKSDKYNPAFLANTITHVQRNQIAELTQGITIHHLYGKNLKNLLLRLPSLPEQTAIAEVLSDIDAEIATLETRLEKTRALKQGMMQELLTGRIRLV